jgi:DNA polymerase-3 subunit gamma/tau
VTQVLARKWRPRDFTQLVGQEHVVRALTNALREQRLHHAYLFTGTRGVGKTTLARIIAKALNCETGVTDTPCGQCGPCSEIDTGRFVDLIELDAASNTQVDNMRELLENAMYAPTAGRYKVYIIDEVHMLSRNAFNAMLKTLEEPPEHVKFVLATTDPQKIPVTVLSRCLQFNLKQIPQKQIQGRLEYILQAEGVAADPNALALIARAAQGSLRDALSLLDQAIAHGGGVVEASSTRAMLGTVDQTYLYTILRALAQRDGEALIRQADAMHERSLSFDMALQELGTLFHRLSLVQVVPQVVDESEPDHALLRELAELFSADELQLYYQITVQARSDIGFAPDEYAAFTMALLRMLAFAPVEDQGDDQGRQAPRLRAVVTGAASETAEDAAPARVHEPAANAVSAEAVPWSELVDQLGVTGMVRMLAQHCELVKLTADRVELTLARAHERLFEKGFQERLKAALQKRYGSHVHVSITLGEASGNSPAEISDRERQRNQARAIAEIEQDPFVRDLVENFDARVNEASIKPIQ